ncbi:DUF2786 domain-containing protein [Morganella morganii]|uniref:DUF2786 domain-containing protein n=1 Tax=Morganella morganii TaxID=582 RepID=UPI0021D0FF0C|nr:DUF2786 domain-containing protein [Morganella morganii]MCU6236746.1 DUF2786 domain-containing protein [Morganella morganii]
MQEKEKIFAKIKKLLAIAMNNSNANEAHSALNQINKYLDKYKISLTDVFSEQIYNDNTKKNKGNSKKNSKDNNSEQYYDQEYEEYQQYQQYQQYREEQRRKEILREKQRRYKEREEKKRQEEFIREQEEYRDKLRREKENAEKLYKENAEHKVIMEKFKAYDKSERPAKYIGYVISLIMCIVLIYAMIDAM